jgi:hypothetical protein
MSKVHDFPALDQYRGCNIHAFQPRERIEHVVKPAIDLVAEMADPVALFEYAANRFNPPEARLLAGKICRKCCELAAAQRRTMPAVDLQKLGALTAGLGSWRWTSPWTYTSMLCDENLPPGAMPSTARDPAEHDRLIADKERETAEARCRWLEQHRRH